MGRLDVIFIPLLVIAYKREYLSRQSRHKFASYNKNFAEVLDIGRSLAFGSIAIFKMREHYSMIFAFFHGEHIF